jgi:hypothetical protein
MFLHGGTGFKAVSLKQLKTYPTTRKFLIGVVAIGPLRVKNCNRTRHLIAREMMVAYDKIYFPLAGV